MTETDFYKSHDNHPLLIALRYLRQVAVAYFRLYGNQTPKTSDLLALMDERSTQAVRSVFAELTARPEALDAFLAHPPFRRRLDKSLAKAFRSYTNPTATKELFDYFGVDRVLEIYGTKIAPYHAFMYRKYRNPADLEKHRAQLGLAPEAYLSTVENYFGSRELKPETFHGTKSMEAYRNIVFQGFIASTGGNAGAGVYMVDSRSEDFAKDWAGEEQLVVKLKLDPNAVVVDITEGPGKEAFEKFKRLAPAWYFDGRKVESKSEPDEYTAFADFVGADILRYPYDKTNAYVLKNGTAILGQEGITIPIMTVEQARKDLEAHGFDLGRLKALAQFDPSMMSHLITPEVFQQLPPDEHARALTTLYYRASSLYPHEQWEVYFASLRERLAELVSNYQPRPDWPAAFPPHGTRLISLVDNLPREFRTKDLFDLLKQKCADVYRRFGH